MSFYGCLASSCGIFGALCQDSRVEPVDIREQLAKCTRAVVEQHLALFRRGLGGVANGARGMKILRLPGKRHRPVRRKPAILLLHRDTAGAKIRYRVVPDL